MGTLHLPKGMEIKRYLSFYSAFADCYMHILNIIFVFPPHPSSSCAWILMMNREALRRPSSLNGNRGKPTSASGIRRLLATPVIELIRQQMKETIAQLLASSAILEMLNLPKYFIKKTQFKKEAKINLWCVLLRCARNWVGVAPELNSMCFRWFCRPAIALIRRCSRFQRNWFSKFSSSTLRIIIIFPFIILYTQERSKSKLKCQGTTGLPCSDWSGTQFRPCLAWLSTAAVFSLLPAHSMAGTWAQRLELVIWETLIVTTN